MVGAAVHAIDHQVRLVVGVTGQPLGCHPPDDTAVMSRLDDMQVPLGACHGALHRAQDIAALAHLAQRSLGVIEYPPVPPRSLPGEP